MANAAGPECVRVAEGGQVLERVTTSQNCYACMLGGEDRTDPLSRHGAHRATPRWPAFERDGALEQIRTSVPGAGLP